MKVIVCEVNKEPYIYEMEQIEILNTLMEGYMKMFFNEDSFAAICKRESISNLEPNNRLNINNDFILVGLQYGKIVSLYDEQIDYIINTILKDTI
ncbi:DUF3846 domain-containing protein [Clostridium folliculivorans]|uniref:DUF3846 domain-containing protein n=1 Tax=Clostridium folliculivorans TaxID=2886038 RepID=A0A9W6DAF5_9CLOT|nr:hypothetical protein [Clostridium folliculivorans]GKU25320.1 hypothetical protein CFOLD11_21460 [Clostridium folliculivorans]GKU28341.1 hypothetical protein CFB3_04470 [Clostridium folliculivorans]